MTTFNLDVKKKRVYWTPENDALLLKLFGGNPENLNWKQLTIDFNMSYKQCYDRYLNINPKVKKGAWTAIEEQRLQELILLYGEKWSLISKKFGGTRSGKQIRHHCKTPFLSDLQCHKTHFTKEEDTLIRKLYQKHGPKWDYISKFFDNRTGNALKNRYFNQKSQQKWKVNEAEELQKKLTSQNLRNFEKSNIKMENDEENSTDIKEESKPSYEYFEFDSEYNFKDEFFKDDSYLDNIFSNKVYFDHSEGK